MPLGDKKQSRRLSARSLPAHFSTALVKRSGQNNVQIRTNVFFIRGFLSLCRLNVYQKLKCDFKSPLCLFTQERVARFLLHSILYPGIVTELLQISDRHDKHLEGKEVGGAWRCFPANGITHLTSQTSRTINVLTLWRPKQTNNSNKWSRTCQTHKMSCAEKRVLEA